MVMIIEQFVEKEMWMKLTIIEFILRFRIQTYLTLLKNWPWVIHCLWLMGWVNTYYIWLWGSSFRALGSVESLVQCHYSQVHSDLE